MRRTVLLALVLVCCGVPATAAAAVPRLQRLVLIVGENTSFRQITPAHAPYLTGTVKPAAAWMTNYHSFTRSSSLGEYIAMLSGQFTKCEANNDTPDVCHQNVPNLFQQLDATHRSWTDWQESMDNPCDWVDHGNDWSENVFVYWIMYSTRAPMIPDTNSQMTMSWKRSGGMSAVRLARREPQMVTATKHTNSMAPKPYIGMPSGGNDPLKIGSVKRTCCIEYPRLFV